MSQKESLDLLKEKYVQQLDPKELIIYNIAKDHLGSSFNLELSIGFIKWKKSYISNKKNSNIK